MSKSSEKQMVDRQISECDYIWYTLGSILIAKKEKEQIFDARSRQDSVISPKDS